MKLESGMFDFRGKIQGVIDRPRRLAEIRAALRRAPIVALVGPRQSGKTTLARQIVQLSSEAYFDLEDPRSLARLAEPMIALAPLHGTVVVAEGPRGPPGRVATIGLPGFSPEELGADIMERHWVRGGFPPSTLARTLGGSYTWRQQFIQTFLERDLPVLGISAPAPMLLRFWTMLAHYHGGVWNAAEPARSLGVSAPTVRRYLDLLSAPYLVRQLHPWHENLGKRQVKSPKVYLRASGLLHALLGIQGPRDLLSHPKVGASWEGYAMEEVLKVVQPEAAYFWGAPTGA